MSFIKKLCISIGRSLIDCSKENSEYLLSLEEDYFNELPLAKVRAAESGLLNYMKNNYSMILEDLRKTAGLTPEIKESLDTVIKEYLRNN